MRTLRLEWTLMVIAILTLSACKTTAPAPAAPDDFDLIIRNGRIVDGTGAPWYRADVAVTGDTIMVIGDLDDASAAVEIDAGNQVVSPGFIDLLGWSHWPVLVDPRLEGKVRQGVTTEATGEGRSPGPLSAEEAARRRERGARSWTTLGEYMEIVEEQGSALNFALFVGATNPREIVLGKNDVDPTEEQMLEMERIVADAMRDGAIGLSTSLVYVPALYASTEEIVRLARVAAEYGGVYFSHIRSENERIIEAVEETIAIGREANIPVNIWHLKVSDKQNVGVMAQVLEMIESARAEGIDIAANLYPYVASSTGLSALAPNWTLEGGYEKLLERLADPEMREQIAQEVRESGFYSRIGGPSGALISHIPNEELEQFEMKRLSEAAEEMGREPVDALLYLLENNPHSPQAIYFSMKEEDMQMALQRPWVSVGADSGAVVGEMRQSGAHPRAYGTFPRVVGHYVREVGLFSLEEAVRKITSQAAARVNLLDRGVLRPGMKADILVFDPDEIQDLSTFEEPHQFSEGIDHVIVNGVPVLRDGEMTGALPGRILRGPGWTEKSESRQKQ
ncbi:MAG: D-aminoacylase [Thermoanaerobaculia bacterium]|nr:D-aminoacylase [Thermoanaerobaculia bacterium]